MRYFYSIVNGNSFPSDSFEKQAKKIFGQKNQFQAEYVKLMMHFRAQEDSSESPIIKFLEKLNKVLDNVLVNNYNFKLFKYTSTENTEAAIASSSAKCSIM